MHSFAVFTLLLCVSLVTARIYPTRFPNTTWDDFNWRLQTQTCDQGHYQGRASLANGYIGINVAALGPFFEADTPVNGDDINGWPLFDRRQSFATVAGFWNSQPTTNGSNFPWLYQYGGESVISGVPHWSGLMPTCKGHVLDASTDMSEISGFTSTYDYKFGTLTWRYTWTPPDCQAFGIEYSMFLNKLQVHKAAVALKITPSRDADITVFDVLEGDAALRTQFVGKGADEKTNTIWSAVSPLNVHNVTAYVYSTLAGDPSVDFNTLKLVGDKDFVGKNKSSIAQSVTLNMRAGKTTRIVKYLGVASSDAIEDPQSVAKHESLEGAKIGYFPLLDLHMEEWRSVMPLDSVDDYRDPATGDLIDDNYAIQQQILAVVSPYYILQNTVGQNAIKAAGGNDRLNRYSVSVGGLTSDSYAGMVFWDADVWMQPGLVLSHPDTMKQVANYRLDRRGQALANVKTAYQSSQAKTKFSPNSAVYSWTSSRWGNCTGTGPCFDYEYHVNGDISLQLENYLIASGDTATFKRDYFPIFDSAAQLFSDLFKFSDSKGKYTLHNATDPDEFANNVNNPAFTMLVAQAIMRRANKFRKQFGMPIKRKWVQQAKNIEVPINPKAGIHLEYAGMDGRVEVKQADVVLIYDFLHYKSKYANGDLAYYAGKQSQSGPAMTYGVFSIVAAEEEPSGCSHYTYDLYGSYPYVRAPWFQFSEQLVDNFQTNGGFHPAFPFLTGMGGANRVAPFGYLGLRLKQEHFDINPTLAPQVPHLRLRTVYWQGYPIKAVLNQTHTTITRLSRDPLPNANPAYANTGIPVTLRRGSASASTQIHMLHPGATLTFATRQPANVKTIAGNLAQCRPLTRASTNSDFVAGQFPMSAVDGSPLTKWQPTSASGWSSITVSLPATSQRIAALSFDWAQAPPDSFMVLLSNASDPAPAQMQRIAAQSHVHVSAPYDKSTIKAVVPYASNTTHMTLARPVAPAKFATLMVRGNQYGRGSHGEGATVAEFAVIAEGAGAD